MAEISLEERLQPSLLDRLTDDEPESLVEARSMRAISVNRLKSCVLRDLASLFNCSGLAITEDLSLYPLVESSVLNYGVADIAGLSVASTDIATLQRKLKQAILNFEPRIIAETLRVTVNTDRENMSARAFVFMIEGQLWAQPMPVGLYVKTELDIETGSASVIDIGG